MPALCRRRLAGYAVLVLLCGACGLSSGPSDDVRPSFLEETREGLACGADRFWCDALDRFEAGDVPEPTVEAYSLIGVGRNSFTGLERVRYFVSRPGERMLVGEVVPSNPDEERQLDEAVVTLRAGGTLPETAPVVGFVRGLATGGSYQPDSSRVEGRSRYVNDGDFELWVRQNGPEIITLIRDGMGTTIAVYRR